MTSKNGIINESFFTKTHPTFAISALNRYTEITLSFNGEVMELNTTNYQQATAYTSSFQAGQTQHEEPSQAPVNTSQAHGQDTVALSKAGKDALSKDTEATSTPQISSSEELSQEDITELTEIKERDVEVRAHEQAHLAAAGGYATGGASFTYQKGPDGQSYAVGGEVGIDLSTESDPNATIQKMQTIKRAALAPASPSSTDRQVAAQAEIKESQARQEVIKEQQDALLHAEEGSPASLIQNNRSDTSGSDASPSIGALKSSIAAYEQMSAM